MNDKNAIQFLEKGASHIIVTSFVFKDGKIHYENLQKMVKTVGKKHLVLDLSCRKKIEENGKISYYIVTDRWQKFTETKLELEILEELSAYCDEFLVHAVDVEGKANGIEEDLLKILAKFDKIPITYAGGVGNFADLERLKELGKDKIHVTIGSALDLFGGSMKYEDVLKRCKE